jgi:peptidoglycan/LPS O-acetylase OafA/YrhL
LTLGEHGVNGFFAVSGFLVAMSWDRQKSAWRFALARLLRVFPGVIVAAAVTALVIGGLMTSRPLLAYLADPGVGRFLWQTLTSFRSATTLPGVFLDNPLPFPFATVWTLRYELLCYAGLLAFGWAGGFRHRWLVALAIAGMAIALTVLALLGPVPKGVETSLRLPLIFSVGVALYLYRDRATVSWLALIALVSLSIGAAIVFPAAYKALLFVATAYGVIVVAIAPGLSHPRLEPPGDISYGVYLYGWPIQQMLFAQFPQADPTAMIAPALLLTALVATASWLLVEKPALALKPSGRGRQAP